MDLKLHKRFAGRAKEFCDLHGKLTANRLSIISGLYGQAVAEVRSMGGNGKSLLAREYSIRFGPAYPRGVPREKSSSIWRVIPNARE